MAVKKRMKPDAHTQQKMEEAAAKERIRVLNAGMALCGVSQRMLAEQAGIDQAHVNRILTGKVARPMFWTLLRLETAVEHFAGLVTRKGA